MIYRAIVDALGEPATAMQGDIAYAIAGAILILACFALVRVATWLFKV